MDMANVVFNYGNAVIDPAPTVSYSTELIYSNDLVIGYQYNITLNGYCIGDGITNAVEQSRILHNIFNSNGSFIKFSVNDTALLYAADVKIKSISFNESPNFWSVYIPYTVELTANHLHLGSDVANDAANIELGKEDLNAIAYFQSPNIINIQNHKLRAFSENFSINTDDNIFKQLAILDDTNPSSMTGKTYITNNYFTITYSLSATGKHDVINSGGNKYTLPAWEHAKRWVHLRLSNQIGNMYNGLQFMGVGEYTTLDSIHSNAGSPLINSNSIYNLYNESLNFDVSESDGTFSAEYTVLVKQICRPDFSIGCTNSTLHNVTKKINKQYDANETIGSQNQNISISIDGEISGLMPAGGIRNGLQLDLLGTGSFITFIDDLEIDKNLSAQQLLNNIFDFQAYDFKSDYKNILGINATNLQINPATDIKPSKMVLTRNYLKGTINYSAEYNNKFNCPTNHFDIQVDVEEPTPIIKEFIIPNNNPQDPNNGSGYSVIQKLGTKTAKKINVTIDGNIGETFDKCCLGTNEDWNLLAYNYFSLTDFTLPSGVIIPEITPDFVLTQKRKQTTFPDGTFTINLSYTCANICEISFQTED